MCLQAFASRLVPPRQAEAQCSSITPHQHALDLVKSPGSLKRDQNTFRFQDGERHHIFLELSDVPVGSDKTRGARWWNRAEHNKTAGWPSSASWHHKKPSTESQCFQLSLNNSLTHLNLKRKCHCCRLVCWLEITECLMRLYTQWCCGYNVLSVDVAIVAGWKLPSAPNRNSVLSPSPGTRQKFNQL